MIGQLVNNQYEIVKTIGKGSFGEIYEGLDKQSNQRVAIKCEVVGIKDPQLVYESKMYQILSNVQNYPKLFYYGQCDTRDVVVMSLLGPSLERLINECGGKFSLKTTLLVADQMILRLETFHNKTFLHRDQKPGNYCVGLMLEKATVFMIDYGLAKRYMSQGQHIQQREDRPILGTIRYCSINSHLGIEQSRRDDLESIGYIFIYFLRGSLPWQGLKAKSKKLKYEKIKEKKLATPLDQLCRGFPPEFSSFLSYCKAMNFEDKPDYTFLRKNFQELAAKSGFRNDLIFDWTERGIDTDKMVLDTNREPELSDGMKDEEDDFLTNKRDLDGTSHYQPSSVCFSTHNVSAANLKPRKLACLTLDTCAEDELPPRVLTSKAKGQHYRPSLPDFQF